MKRALDLFCGGGGAGMGLHRAGFEVVGVDLHPQPKYPFEFIQADALTFSLDGFDFVWASPVCKKFSSASRTSKSQDRWPDQIDPIRTKLIRWGGNWIIENVTTAPLKNTVTLCGLMFGLDLYRHRNFESSKQLTVPEHPEHKWKVAKMGRPPKHGEILNPVGHFSDVPLARRVMEIPWLGQKELSQAIPPAYSEYLAKQFIRG